MATGTPTQVETNAEWGKGRAARLSVVMIGHRSAALLREAVQSLLEKCPGGEWELVIVVNGGDPAVLACAREQLARPGLGVAVARVPEQRPGDARNAGVRVARAPLLFFLDDDTICFQNVVGAAIDLFRDPSLEAAGGANLTPPRSGALARATGAALATRFGAAGMSRRYRLAREGEATEHALILCNLAVRRSALEGARGFARNLVSNEENVLLQRLAAGGARFWSSPRLAVFHRRRDTWRGLAAQAAKYGAGRAQNVMLVPESASPLYFLPSLLLAGSLCSLAIAPLTGPASLVPFALYLTIALARSVALSAWHRDPAMLLGTLVFPCVHLSYGFGFLRALLVFRPEALPSGSV